MKTVIEMAREAGFNKNELAYLGDNFTRFAELVRADAIAAIEGLERNGIWITREEAIAAIQNRSNT